MKKTNRVVVIIGASSGFGRGAALKLAEAGDTVVLAARRKRLLKQVADECRQSGAEALVVQTDVSEPSEVEELASRALSEFGRIDIWVNDAGVGTVGRFDETPLEDHEQVIRTNLLGTIYGSYAALQQFHKQGEGILINIASFAGEIAPPLMSSYAASKFGVRGLGMALRQELEQSGERNIHVCTVMPVSFDTPFFEHAGSHTGKKVQPIPPTYNPEKVVEVIASLTDKPQDEVVVGPTGKLGALAHRIAPRLVEKQMGRRAFKSQGEQSEPAQESSGSLFKPTKGGDEVHGGWNDGGSAGKLGTILGIAVPAAMGIVYLLQRRRQAGSREEAA